MVGYCILHTCLPRGVIDRHKSLMISLSEDVQFGRVRDYRIRHGLPVLLGSKLAISPRISVHLKIFSSSICDLHNLWREVF